MISTLNTNKVLSLGTAILFLMLAISLTFIAGELKYFSFDPEILGRYTKIKFVLAGHLAGGILALIIGPFQFSSYFRNNYMSLHKKLGKVYIIAIILSALFSTVMAWTTALAIHITWALSLQVLAFTWIVSALMAYFTVKQKRIVQHKQWMIRSYIVTLVFISFRYINEYMHVAEMGTFVERASSIIYVTLFVPLFIAEVIFNWKES